MRCDRLFTEGMRCKTSLGIAASPELSADAVRRRMRAVTGSSAEECFCRSRCGVVSMLCAALSALIFSASRKRLAPHRCGSARSGKSGLELVTQAGQFGQVGVVQEGLAEPGLVVAKLGLGDGEVLPDTFAFGAVSARQSFQGVQDGTRPLVFP